MRIRKPINSEFKYGLLLRELQGDVLFFLMLLNVELLLMAIWSCEAEINKGISSEKIFLAGFSQGGAIALHTGLRYSQPLGGIIALSSYLPLNDTVENEIHAANRNIPIFMAHGIIDNVISLNYAELSRERLKKLNYDIEWHQYHMEHTVHPEEINDISSFITNFMEI